MQNFNNYNNPYNYQPNSYQPSNNYMRPQMNQYAFVNGVEGAKSFMIQPNQTVMLMDSDNPICYMKQSNSLGQSTLRYFKLVETDENTVRNLNNPTPIPSNQEFVLKADFDALNQRVDEILKSLRKDENKEV